MAGTVVERCVGSTFGRGHLSHGCVMAFVRMSTSTFTGVRAFSSNWVTVNVPKTRQEGGYGEPWVVLMLRGHMQGSLAQAWCLCCTPEVDQGRGCFLSQEARGL